MRGEVAREPARSEKIGEGLAVVVTEGPARGAMKPGHLGQHAHVAAPPPGQPGGQAGQAALAGVLQAAPGAADDMLISDGWVATPSSANSLVSRG
jgi:hypothetical protein